MFFRNPEDPNEPEMILVDWQFYGYGNPSTEFAYLLDNIDYDPIRDYKLMKIYHGELMDRLKVPEETYTFNTFQRECEIRTIGFSAFSFAMFPRTPEEGEKFRKKMKDFESLEENAPAMLDNRFRRFSDIIQKWKKENIYEQICLKYNKKD
jgi:hypothetical protein